LDANIALAVMLASGGPGNGVPMVSIGSGLESYALVAIAGAMISDAELAYRGDRLLVARKSTSTKIADPGASQRVTLPRKVVSRGKKLFSRLRIFR